MEQFHSATCLSHFSPALVCPSGKILSSLCFPWAAAPVRKTCSAWVFHGLKRYLLCLKHLLLFWPRCCLRCFSLFLFPPLLFIPYFSPLSYICLQEASPAGLMGYGGSTAEPAGPCCALLMGAPDHFPEGLFLQSICCQNITTYTQ